jgi:ADP-dependent NAD(P)H-hydrate dehydratase / NAD(P)H-hydrate epimerase
MRTAGDENRPGARAFTPDRDVAGRERVWALTALEAAALDRAAVDRHDVPEPALMESAGRAAAAVLQRLFPRGRVVAAVGAGNNGGDALVVLRVLRSWGRDVGSVLAASRAPDPGLLHGWDVSVSHTDAAASEFGDADVLVDGVLGTGARGAAREPAAAVIRALNGAGRPILALDLPSGVDPTSGAVPGDAVSAAVTVSFGEPKLGLLLQPARDRCGRLMAVEIGFPPADLDAEPGAALITPGWVLPRLPQRRPDAYKGTAGRLLVLVGREGVGGAAVICTRGALRGGAGYVHVASVAGNRTVLQTTVPDAVFLDRDAEEDLSEMAGATDALVAGPGMGTDAAARRVLVRVLEASGRTPVLLDADALTMLAADANLQDLLAKRTVVVTPHPGEMARLVGGSAADIVADRPGRARALAQERGWVVLLKGQPSVVAAPGEPVLVNTAGSSDVATAGMGDFLSGAIGALLGAGLAGRDAAGVGLFLCSRTADLARRGPSLSPLDLGEHYHRAWAEPGAVESSLGLPFITFDQPPRW